MSIYHLYRDCRLTLDVVWRPHKLHTRERSLGDQARSMATLCAPRNGFTFGIANQAIGVRRPPQAKVVDAVDNRRLAERRLTLSLFFFYGVREQGIKELSTWTDRRVANVVAMLGSTLTGSSVCLVRKRSIRKALGRERGERAALGKDDGRRDESSREEREHDGNGQRGYSLAGRDEV